MRLGQVQPSRRSKDFLKCMEAAIDMNTVQS